jgi:transposase-like protein
LYKGYRFPPAIISHCVWLYFRFGVSLRDVSELMLARGIEVSHEAIRLWTLRFGSEYARRLRRSRGPCLERLAPRRTLPDDQGAARLVVAGC